MKRKEKDEIIEVFQVMIKYLEKNLDKEYLFLCSMSDYIAATNKGVKIKCGWNDRLLPNAISYLKSQKPTKTRNKTIYESPYYNKRRLDIVWWYYWSNGNIAVNTAKIDFLKHLIQKLKR